MDKIIKTGFYVSLVSLVTFLFFEYFISGFVSNYFPINILVIFLLVFAVLYAFYSEKSMSRFGQALAFALIFGILFAYLVVRELDASNEYRFLISFFVLILPTIIIGIIYER